MMQNRIQVYSVLAGFPGVGVMLMTGQQNGRLFGGNKCPGKRIK